MKKTERARCCTGITHLLILALPVRCAEVGDDHGPQEERHHGVEHHDAEERIEGDDEVSNGNDDVGNLVF